MQKVMVDSVQMDGYIWLVRLLKIRLASLMSGFKGKKYEVKRPYMHEIKGLPAKHVILKY
ncbi:hypothetical protein HW35_08200 [Bacillus sp. X1(2014)]|nr:hypothetical protein HW35_08200 [Bacillus sp. X1(2014)]